MTKDALHVQWCKGVGQRAATMPASQTSELPQHLHAPLSTRDTIEKTTPYGNQQTNECSKT